LSFQSEEFRAAILYDLRLSRPLMHHRRTKRMRKPVERKPRSTDHPKVQRAVGRPAMHEVIGAAAKVAQLPRVVVHSIRGGLLRNLAAWLGWHEGLVTLRSIAAALRLRSERHISNLIRRR
jgi:hypothetical protein